MRFVQQKEKRSLRGAFSEETDNIKSTVFTLSYDFFTKRKKRTVHKKSARFAVLLRKILITRKAQNWLYPRLSLPKGKRGLSSKKKRVCFAVLFGGFF